MGLLKHLLFWPVTGPKFLVEFSLRRVEGVVRDELTDEDRIKEELLELQLRLELGEVNEAEYAAREGELMDRLREAQIWRERYGMSTRGPVRVAPAEPAGEDEGKTGLGGTAIDLHLDFEDDGEGG